MLNWAKACEVLDKVFQIILAKMKVYLAFLTL